MLEQSILQNYLDILREELVPATGCTEPIAIAYAAPRPFGSCWALCPSR